MPSRDQRALHGREYLLERLRPEHTEPEQLQRLRGLSHKRSLGLRRSAPGIRGLERFGRGDLLRRVHECIVGVMAPESEPVDPRL